MRLFFTLVRKICSKTVTFTIAITITGWFFFNYVDMCKLFICCNVCYVQMWHSNVTLPIFIKTVMNFRLQRVFKLNLPWLITIHFNVFYIYSQSKMSKLSNISKIMWKFPVSKLSRLSCIISVLIQQKLVPSKTVKLSKILMSRRNLVETRHDFRQWWWWETHLHKPFYISYLCLIFSFSIMMFLFCRS